MALGLPPRHWIVSGSFIYALVLVVFLVPPQVYRTMAYPDTVSPSSAVAMMQAPCSLTALTWGAMRRGAQRYAA